MSKFQVMLLLKSYMNLLKKFNISARYNSHSEPENINQINKFKSSFFPKFEEAETRKNFFLIDNKIIVNEQLNIKEAEGIKDIEKNLINMDESFDNNYKESCNPSHKSPNKILKKQFKILQKMVNEQQPSDCYLDDIISTNKDFEESAAEHYSPEKSRII